MLYDVKMLKPEEIIMYLRKSRADDPLLTVEEVLQKHETLLDEWAERNLIGVIPTENRFKEVVSGESISDRPYFQEILKLVEKPTIKAVFVVDISRLGRPDTAEIGLISKIFRYTHTLVITPERTFNITDEFEREMFESELKRGNFYLEYAKKLLKRGRESSVKSGNYVCSKPPYGYDKTIIMDGKRKCPTLVINEEQANIIRRIFDQYVNENVGTQTIANRLNDLGIKSPRGLLWQSDAILTILDNIHYIGKVRWNERKAVCVVNNGEFHKTRPKSPDDEVIICDGKHEAIISEELFYKAKEKRGRCHKTCNNRELRNPLASILFCTCGKAMVYRQSVRNGVNRGEPRLVCNFQHQCGTASCSVNELVDYVAQVLRDRIAYFEEKIENHDSTETDFHEKYLQSLEKKLSDIDAKEVALWESQLDVENRMPSNIFQTLTAKLIKEREETKTAIEKTRNAIATPSTYTSHLVTLEEALSALLDPTVSVVEKNHFLKACIEKIIYKREPTKKIVGKGAGRGWIYAPIEVEVILKI